MQVGFLTVQAQQAGFTGNERLSYACLRVSNPSNTVSDLFFNEDTIGRLFNLLMNEIDVVVGFNIINYGYKVLQKYAPPPMSLEVDVPTFDIFDAILQETETMVKFTALASALGLQRLAEGLEYVDYWNNHQYAEIRVSMVRDCFILHEAYNHCMEQPNITIPMPNHTGLDNIEVETAGWQSLIPVIAARSQDGNRDIINNDNQSFTVDVTGTTNFRIPF